MGKSTQKNRGWLTINWQKRPFYVFMIHYFTLKWAKRSVKVLAVIKTGLYKLLNAITVDFFSGKDFTKVKIDATAWQKNCSGSVYCPVTGRKWSAVVICNFACCGFLIRNYTFCGITGVSGSKTHLFMSCCAALSLLLLRLQFYCASLACLCWSMLWTWSHAHVSAYYQQALCLVAHTHSFWEDLLLTAYLKL